MWRCSTLLEPWLVYMPLWTSLTFEFPIAASHVWWLLIIHHDCRVTGQSRVIAQILGVDLPANIHFTILVRSPMDINNKTNALYRWMTKNVYFNSKILCKLGTRLFLSIDISRKLKKTNSKAMSLFFKDLLHNFLI